MHVRVSIHSPSQHCKKPDRAEGDEQTTTHHLAPALDEARNVPAKNEDRSSSCNQQDGVAQGKSKRDSERARASRVTGAAHRERYNRQQVIGPETVHETQSKRARNQQHRGIVYQLGIRDQD